MSGGAELAKVTTSAISLAGQRLAGLAVPELNVLGEPRHHRRAYAVLHLGFDPHHTWQRLSNTGKLKRRLINCAIADGCSIHVGASMYPRSNAAGNAAINPDILSGYVACAVRYQEGGSCSDLLGFPIPPHRHAAAAFLSGRQAVHPAGQYVVMRMFFAA